MSLEFSYELIGTGWAECTLRVGEQVATVYASYLSDGLADLGSATAAALRGHPCPSASFADEPGEYRWVLEPQSAGQVRIRILGFAKLWGGQADEEGVVLLDEECRLRTFAGAIVSELQRLEMTHGRAGYREQWVNHDFPAELLAELQELLRVPSSGE